MGMVTIEVSEITFYGAPRNNFLSYVAIVLSNSIIIRKLKLIKRESGGLLLSMPSEELPEGRREIVCPISRGSRAMLETAVFEAWKARQSSPI